MSIKRKISVRKILQLTLTLVVVTASVMGILSASSVQEKKKIAGIDIRIKNSQYHFIDRQQVMDMLVKERNLDLSKTSLNKLDVHQLESVLDANPWVADAEVYVDSKQQLHVWITQRVPVARLFEQDGNSYYLDQTLKAMPLSTKYTHYTTVVTNVPVLNDDSLSDMLKAQIVSLVKFIDKDTFWNAQVSQVIVTDDKKFELVPVLGKQRILFGDTTQMQNKFSKLFAFYKKVLNKIGWDKYEVLDVRFASQVVASPALEWKKPAANAMSNMDWVKTVIGNEPITFESDTTTDAVITNTIVNASQKTAAGVTPQPAKPVAQPATVVAKPVTQPAPVTANANTTPAVQSMVKKVAVPQQQQQVQKQQPKKPAPAKPQVQAAKPEKKTIEKPKADKEKDNKEKSTKEKSSNEPSPKYIYQGN